MTTLLLNIDKTILHSYSLFYPLASLKPEDALDLAPHPPVLTADPAEWRDHLSRLHRAYLSFVSLVAQEETSEEPLGLFRPGIMDFMERVQNLYRTGVIRRVVLYSSHPFKPLVAFARDVIRMVLVAGLSSPSLPSSLSSSPSTSSVPHTLLPIELAPHGPKHLLELETDSVYLVDDQPSALFLPVKGQTLCLPPYVFKASFVRVGELYVQALRAAKVSFERAHDLNWFLFSTPSCHPFTGRTQEETILSFLGQRTGTTALPTQSPPRGNGLLSLFHMLDKMERTPIPSKEGLNKKDIPPSE